jgi:ribonuclease D
VPALGGDLGGLWDLFLDPSVLKILHAGGQDMEILAARIGHLPQPVYDTQVAAAFTGYNLQTGYGALVQAVLGVRLSKEEGFADWSRRPLTPAMREYAENDVRYLPALHSKLDDLLRKRGRDEWAAEQTQRLLGQAAAVPEPEDLWRRVGGRNALDSRGLAVLRELAFWRDEEARRRDKPRRTVLKDEVLIDVARRTPRSAADVLALRSAPQNLGERAAEAIVAAVRRGLAVPEAERPRPETSVPLDEQGAALVELLSAVVRVRAAEANLPPSLLAGGDDLRALAANRRSPDTLAGELFTGWRGHLLGDDLRAVLAGDLAVSWDSRAGRLRLVRGDKANG